VAALRVHCRFGLSIACTGGAAARLAPDGYHVQLAPDGCRVQLAPADIDAHEAACEYAVFTCGRRVGARACGAAFRSRDQAHHDAVCAGLYAAPAPWQQPWLPPQLEPLAVQHAAWQLASLAVRAAAAAVAAADTAVAAATARGNAVGALAMPPLLQAAGALPGLPPLPLPPPACAPADALAAQLASLPLPPPAPPAPPSCSSLLGALVQALYHIFPFKYHVVVCGALPPDAPAGAPQLAPSMALATALRQLFFDFGVGGVRLRHSTKEEALTPAQQDARTEQYVRRALAALADAAGAMNEMTNARQLLDWFDHALQQLSCASHPELPADATPVSFLFGMEVAEHAECGGCGAVLHELDYAQSRHVVQAAALRAAAAAAPRRATLEALLHRALGGETKRCERGERGCGRAAPIRHWLSRRPNVFTLSIAWDTAAAPEAQVAATMAALRTTLRLDRVYSGAVRTEEQAEDEAAKPPYELRAMLVRHRGAQYSSFARTDEGPSAPAVWTRFGDASVTFVGSWQAVCAECARERLQPDLLFFEELVMP
jgi:hypothetical protein